MDKSYEILGSQSREVNMKPTMEQRIDRAYARCVRLMKAAMEIERQLGFKAAKAAYARAWRWNDHHNALCWQKLRGVF
jgi:hypothetical protein